MVKIGGNLGIKIARHLNLGQNIVTSTYNITFGEVKNVL